MKTDEILKFPKEIQNTLVDKRKQLVRQLNVEKFTGDQIAYIVGMSKGRVSQILREES